MRSTTVAVLALVLLVAVCQPALAKKEKKGPKITQKVFFDITIGGKEAGAGPPASLECAFLIMHARKIKRQTGDLCPDIPIIRIGTSILLMWCVLSL